MIGLENFRAHFKGFEDHYVIIGGTACSLLVENVGLNFRATKDIDVVLLVENLSAAFAKHFWEFINLGEYSNISKSTDHRNFYRFEKPLKPDYPIMIELFARKPGELPLLEGSHLLPLHIADDISSLSAILLDDDYYNFMKQGVRVISGISLLDEYHLIPFKAKAWCELSNRNKSGEVGLTKHIKKHRKDIIVLYSLTKASDTITLYGQVLHDMRTFLNEMILESTQDKVSVSTWKGLAKLYRIDNQNI